jgi:hypothetical protein
MRGSDGAVHTQISPSLLAPPYHSPRINQIILPLLLLLPRKESGTRKQYVHRLRIQIETKPVPNANQIFAFERAIRYERCRSMMSPDRGDDATRMPTCQRRPAKKRRIALLDIAGRGDPFTLFDSSPLVERSIYLSCCVMW